MCKGSELRLLNKQNKSAVSEACGSTTYVFVAHVILDDRALGTYVHAYIQTLLHKHMHTNFIDSRNHSFIHALIHPFIHSFPLIPFTPFIPLLPFISFIPFISFTHSFHSFHFISSFIHSFKHTYALYTPTQTHTHKHNMYMYICMREQPLGSIWRLHFHAIQVAISNISNN